MIECFEKRDIRLKWYHVWLQLRDDKIDNSAAEIEYLWDKWWGWRWEWGGGMQRREEMETIRMKSHGIWRNHDSPKSQEWLSLKTFFKDFVKLQIIVFKVLDCGVNDSIPGTWWE